MFPAIHGRGAPKKPILDELFLMMAIAWLRAMLFPMPFFMHSLNSCPLLPLKKFDISAAEVLFLIL
jgi:hypothetical protein